MCLRRKRNRSSSVSIVIVGKSSGSYREIIVFDISSSAEELELFTFEASVRLLESAGYKYILGPVFGESPKIREWMLGVDRTDKCCEECEERVV